MKNFVLFILLFCWQEIIAQSDQKNQEKYWKYREMLKSKFVKIGTEDGGSIPLACRIPSYAYGETHDPNGTQLQWKDATITLGYYILMLATEYKLLHNAGQDKVATLNEMYYALNAIDRLDLSAEEYLSDAESNPSLNGFFIRDDVPYNFWQNWENDGPLYPELFDDPNVLNDVSDPGNPNRSDSDYNGLNDSNGQQQNFPSQGNAESLDQLTSLLTGLLAVYTLVNDEIVQPESGLEAKNLKAEARAIALRLIHYVMKNENEGEFSPRFKIYNQDNVLVDRGFDCTGASWALVKIAMRFGDNQTAANYNDFQQADIPLVVPSSDLYYAIAASNAPCMNDLQDQLHDLYMGTGINEPITIAHVPMEMIKHYVTEVEATYMDIGIGSTPCYTFSIGEIAKIIHLDLELPGICEDVIYDIVVDALSPVVIALDLQFAPYYNWIFNKEIPGLNETTCFNSLNHDNLHIILELMINSNLWSNDSYVQDMAGPEFKYINLLSSVLNNNSQPYSNINKSEYQALLNSAPCAGPWSDPNDINNHATGGWASPCQLFKGPQTTGPSTSTGEP